MLGQNERVREAFASLSEADKKQVLEAARQMSSRAEIQRLIAGLECGFAEEIKGYEWESIL